MLSPQLFSVIRIAPGRGQKILALVNVTDRVWHLKVPLSKLGTKATHWYDLVSKMEWMAENRRLSLTLQPYDILWLTPFKKSG